MKGLRAEREETPMRVRRVFAARRLLLVVLAVGLAGFVALHSALLFSADQPIHVLVRRVWLAGLGLTVVLVYLSATVRRPSGE